MSVFPPASVIFCVGLWRKHEAEAAIPLLGQNSAHEDAWPLITNNLRPAKVRPATVQLIPDGGVMQVGRPQQILNDGACRADPRVQLIPVDLSLGAIPPGGSRKRTAFPSDRKSVV